MPIGYADGFRCWPLNPFVGSRQRQTIGIVELNGLRLRQFDPRIGLQLGTGRNRDANNLNSKWRLREARKAQFVCGADDELIVARR